MDDGKARILVVDDEQNMRAIISRRLRAEGYVCVTAADGKEAMETASKQDFDMVLTDMSMPVMSGMEVLAQMATDHPGTCVLVLTAVTDTRTTVEALSLGAYDYVTKPFNLDDLITRVETALERRRLMLEAPDRGMGQSEESVQALDDEFKRLAEHMGNGYFVVQGSRIVYANDRSARMVGCTPEELTGTAVEELLTPEAMNELSKVHKKRLRGEDVPHHFETMLVKSDGSLFPVDFGAGLIDHAGSPALSVVIRDISEHMRTKEQLHLAEEKYRTIFENSAVAITVTDENENIVSWNQFTEFLLGMDEGDLYMRPVSSLYPDDEWGMIRAQNIRQKGMQHHLETRVITKTQEIIDVDLSVSVYKGPDGNVAGSIGMITDVTDRKLAQEQLRSAEKNYRTIFENSAVAVTVTDENENIVSWNKFTEFLLGMDKDDLFMRPVSSLYPEEEWSMIRAQNIRQKGMQHHLETRIVRKDLEIIDVDLSISVFKGAKGKITGSIGIIADITDRKVAQEQLESAEQNYRAIFENSAVAIMVTDENENIVSWNRYTEFLLGVEKDDLHMRPISSLYPEEEWRMIRAQNIRQKGMQHHLETRIVGKNQQIIDVDLSVSVLKDDDGRVTGSIGVMKDITERKRMERERQRTEEQLEFTARLTTVGELTAGVAHELNNPLAAVQAFAQFVTSREDLDESLRRDLDTIYSEAQRAAKITSNLLSFARVHEPEKSLISINEVIDKSLELQAYHMRVNNIEVIEELDPDLPMTLADFHRMQQVFVNILTNAEQAMSGAHGRGRLVVKTQEVGGTIRITITDDGPGILEENQKRMFDPFFTTKDVGKGTGLGLNICRSIVDKHGGRIWAESRLSEGTTFTVEIPIVEADESTTDNAASIHVN
ncbi:MAG: PAS domain S-box protein [Dehalococcoidia bacterium]